MTEPETVMAEFTMPRWGLLTRYAHDPEFHVLVTRLAALLKETGIPLGFGIVEDALEVAMALEARRRYPDDTPHPTPGVGAGT